MRLDLRRGAIEKGPIAFAASVQLGRVHRVLPIGYHWLLAGSTGFLLALFIFIYWLSTFYEFSGDWIYTGIYLFPGPPDGDHQVPQQPPRGL